MAISNCYTILFKGNLIRRKYDDRYDRIFLYHLGHVMKLLLWFFFPFDYGTRRLNRRAVFLVKLLFLQHPWPCSPIPTLAWLPSTMKFVPLKRSFLDRNKIHSADEFDVRFLLRKKQLETFQVYTNGGEECISSSTFSILSNTTVKNWDECQDQDSYHAYQSQKLDLQLLLLDNYDSYTYNIYSYLSTMCKQSPIVVSNDAYSSWEHLKQSIGKTIDAIVISPGPGRPEEKEDMGICLEIIRENPDLPILGICLGHQALGYYYNATVQLAPNGPVHGLLSPIRYRHRDEEGAKNKVDTCDLFRGIPQEFNVVRYHSLVVECPTLMHHDSELMIEPIAWCKSDTEAERLGRSGRDDRNDMEICMALQHKIYPHYGVQFHPESVGTGKYGYQLLKNFCEYCVQRRDGLSLLPEKSIYEESSFMRNNYVCNAHSTLSEDISREPKYKVLVHKVSNEQTSTPRPEIVFEQLFAFMDDSFWLDSSNGRKGTGIMEESEMPFVDEGTGRNECPITSNSRFSVMGGNLGPLCKKIEYWGKNHKIENRGIFVRDFASNQTHKVDNHKDILSFLREEILENGIAEDAVGISLDGNASKCTFDEMPIQVPFEFLGGYVGYLGYEVWLDTMMPSSNHDDVPSESAPNPLVPTAAFLFADRSLVYDHWKDEWYLIGLVQTSDEETHSMKQGVVQWMRHISDTMLRISSTSSREPSQRENICHDDNNPLLFQLKRTKDEYSADISKCHEKIRQGESYELCLTNQLTTQVSFSGDSIKRLSSTPLGLYKILRENNPAPFSSFMNFNSLHHHGYGANKSSVSICCSSPERFLSIRRENKVETKDSLGHGWEFRPPFVSKYVGMETKMIVESKPIKGTKPRVLADERLSSEKAKVKDRNVAKDLQLSTKNRAENLMIVDLLRNDLSRVCEAGSVHVPKLMGIESFATVHQMVSTIRGNVDPAATAVDVIAACFPGGSMTGAPKLRSVDILNKLELGESRGPYSGCLGYISLNGAMDMNIIIRTAVVTPCDPVGNNTISWNVSIGAGGAITALSESDDEFEEMLLKAYAIRKSVDCWSKNNLLNDRSGC